MKQVRVSKERLLETLTTNREIHNADFDIAWEGFREKAAENLEAKLKMLKAAEHATKVDIWVNLEAPVNYDADYARAIEMIDWELEDWVELSETEFRQYVQNNWAWTERFTISNRLYAGSASPSTNNA